MKQREEQIEKENFKFLERKKEITSIFFLKKEEWIGESVQFWEPTPNITSEHGTLWLE